MEGKILYFDKPGQHNQKKLIQFAQKRATELGIQDIVVATTHGGTALAVKEAFPEDTKITAVTLAEGFSMREGWCIKPEERKNLEEKGITVLTAGEDIRSRDQCVGLF